MKWIVITCSSTPMMFGAHVFDDGDFVEGGVQARVASQLAEDLILAVVANTDNRGRVRDPEILSLFWNKFTRKSQ